MVKMYQFLSIVLVMQILDSIDFATASPFWGTVANSHSLRRPPVGKCKKTCDATESETKLGRYCDSGLKYCYIQTSFSLWSGLKKLFAGADECLVGGSTEKMAGSYCRKGCSATEVVIDGPSASCKSGLVCCQKDPQITGWDWSVGFPRLILNDHKQLSKDDGNVPRA